MAENKWSHFYSPRRYSITVFDSKDNAAFHLDPEEVLENGLDKMNETEQREWLLANYGDVIENNIESRG